MLLGAFTASVHNGQCAVYQVPAFFPDEELGDPGGIWTEP